MSENSETVVDRASLREADLPDYVGIGLDRIVLVDTDALAEENHFGRAALRVHVSQPALSVQIRELEERLGAQLVERGGRRIDFTPAGRAVLGRARRILKELGELQQAARRSWRSRSQDQIHPEMCDEQRARQFG